MNSIESELLHILITISLVLLNIVFIARAILRPHREPASRVAWVVVIVVFPILGVVAYILLGETNIGRKRTEHVRNILAGMPKLSYSSDSVISAQASIPENYQALFRVGQTINGFEPVAGNRADLLQDSNASIAAIIADIDAAQQHVHIEFYIWLADNNGLAVAEALKRAAKRNVCCRAMADGLGSRALIESKHWQAMKSAGVNLAVTLPIGMPILRSLKGRVDLRNHRKIVVIDNFITYCGSQNCADPEFLVKAKFAPWVDAMIRFEGPIARQNQHLFISDWMAEVAEDLNYLLNEPLANTGPGFPAQVIGTGPTIRYSAMPEVFETLMYAAKHELIISTPYFVPDESMLAALCASARRGVKTSIIFPARNDSWIVGAASRSYYNDLLVAGVLIFEFEGGLLHTKSLTLDGEITLIGSANMDRRSFELNYENNILLYDKQLSQAMCDRQQQYLKHSHSVTLEMIEQWSLLHRLANNTVAMFGPVL